MLRTDVCSRLGKTYEYVTGERNEVLLYLLQLVYDIFLSYKVQLKFICPFMKIVLCFGQMNSCRIKV